MINHSLEQFVFRKTTLRSDQLLHYDCNSKQKYIETCSKLVMFTSMYGNYYFLKSESTNILLFKNQLHRITISQVKVHAYFFIMKTHLCDASQASSSFRRSLMMSELELKEYTSILPDNKKTVQFHLHGTNL